MVPRCRGRIEADTVVSNGSWDAATRAAGAAIDAVNRVVKGEDTRAFCAIRPPGHHALADGPNGVLLVQQCRHRCPVQPSRQVYIA